MKFYDYEVLKDWDAMYMWIPFKITMYEYVKSCYSPNDSFFVGNILKGLTDDRIRDELITSIFIAFYRNFSGDRKMWLNHTMNIVFAFHHTDLNHWLQDELNSICNVRITPESILLQHKNKFIDSKRKIDDILHLQKSFAPE